MLGEWMLPNRNESSPTVLEEPMVHICVCMTRKCGKCFFLTLLSLSRSPIIKEMEKIENWV